MALSDYWHSESLSPRCHGELLLVYCRATATASGENYYFTLPRYRSGQRCYHDGIRARECFITVGVVTQRFGDGLVRSARHNTIGSRHATSISMARHTLITLSDIDGDTSEHVITLFVQCLVKAISCIIGLLRRREHARHRNTVRYCLSRYREVYLAREHGDTGSITIMSLWGIAKSRLHYAPTLLINTVNGH